MSYSIQPTMTYQMHTNKTASFVRVQRATAKTTAVTKYYYSNQWVDWR